MSDAPIGVGAGQAGGLDRLLLGDRDVALGGLGHDQHMMPRHHLALVPFEVNLAVSATRLHPARVGHVTGLDRVDPEFLVEVETRAHLLLIMGDAGRRLVVADDMHTLGLGVSGAFR